VRAEGDLEQSPERVFAFLGDLRNHWRLSRRFVELERLDRDAEGAWVRIRGPLGLSRHAHTRIDETDPPRLLRGRAELGPETVGRIRWTVEPCGSGSRVTLEAEVVEASLVDRLVLALGGRRWIALGLREAVEQLAEQA
jgi:uncharacterized protein YndB with AHSA1/START domain